MPLSRKEFLKLSAGGLAAAASASFFNFLDAPSGLAEDVLHPSASVRSMTTSLRTRRRTSRASRNTCANRAFRAGGSESRSAPVS